MHTVYTRYTHASISYSYRTTLTPHWRRSILPRLPNIALWLCGHCLSIISVCVIGDDFPLAPTYECVRLRGRS